MLHTGAIVSVSATAGRIEPGSPKEAAVEEFAVFYLYGGDYVLLSRMLTPPYLALGVLKNVTLNQARH